MARRTTTTFLITISPVVFDLWDRCFDGFLTMDNINRSGE